MLMLRLLLVFFTMHFLASSRLVYDPRNLCNLRIKAAY